MRKIYKIILVIIIILVLLVGSFAIYMKFFREQNTDKENKSSIVHNIDEYGYSLDDRDSKLMKEEFYALEELLKSEEINYTEYAKILSKLFIIDVFTLDNKINKYDIGGVEYILKDEKEKFKNILIESIYSTVLDNSNHDRKQKLPIVKSVSVIDIQEDSYLLGEEEKEAFIVNASWEYEKDLGYDTDAIITLVKENDQLYIVEYNSEISNEEVSEE